MQSPSSSCYYCFIWRSCLYRLLVTLTGWYRKKRPWTGAICWSIVHPHLSSNHSWVTNQSTLANTSRHLAGNREKLGKKWCCTLPTNYLFHTPQGSLTCLNILRHGADGFTSLRRKSFYGLLSLLKIHCLRPGLNAPTSSLIASTTTARPPRPTRCQ
jgi:hypothetical protein